MFSVVLWEKFLTFNLCVCVCVWYETLLSRVNCCVVSLACELRMPSKLERLRMRIEDASTFYIIPPKSERRKCFAF